MNTSPRVSSVSPYKGHRFLPEIISHCVWLYFRFSLSFRNVEEMMVERGVVVRYESVRVDGVKQHGRSNDNHLGRRIASPKNVTPAWLSFALSFLLNSLGPVELVDRSGRGG